MWGDYLPVLNPAHCAPIGRLLHQQGGHRAFVNRRTNLRWTLLREVWNQAVSGGQRRFGEDRTFCIPFLDLIVASSEPTAGYCHSDRLFGIN